MNFAFQVANLAALVTLGLGLMALARPDIAARLVSVLPQGSMGKSEIRGTYGGLFFAMGLVTLISQNHRMFGLLAAAWLGAAGGRLFSLWSDSNRELRNVGGIAFEAALGLLLLLPTLVVWWRNLFG